MRYFRPDENPLGREAAEDLRVIRRLMERSSTYELLSARVGVAAGLIAWAGLLLLWLTGLDGAWPYGMVWAGVFVASLGSVVMCVIQRARERNEAVWSPTARAVVVALFPPFLVGLVLSVWFFARGEHLVMPGLWMLCYSLGALATRPYSPEPIRWLGWVMLLLGALTLALPPAWGNVMMAVAFGLGHMGLAVALDLRERRLSAPAGWRVIRGGAQAIAVPMKSSEER